MANCMCVDTALSVVFQKLGYAVGKYPGYFILVPFFIACILGTGLQRLKYQDDPEYLFSPTDGRSKFERAIIDDYFPVNYTSNFSPTRITHKGRFGRLIIIASDGGSVLRKEVWRNIVELDATIKNLTIEWDDNVYTYEQVCARNEYKCWNNDILDFDSKIEDIDDKKYFLKYPMWINLETYKAYFFPAYLGGVETDENGMITSAKGINLIYFLDTSIKNGDIRGHLWEQAFLEYAHKQPYSNIQVARFVSTTLQKELDQNTHSVVGFFSVTIFIMIAFSVVTCMMTDWVRSKPWLGLFGCVSAGISVVGAFGLCVYCGVEMIGINLAAPFLMLGVGMDDAFVLLAAWRRTNPSMTVAERLSETYAEAAVSITITSLTNFISFMIGIITPFPSVRIFCIYTSVAVLFTYTYHITFFGAIMAYFGEVEKKNLHGLICSPVVPASLSGEKSFFFRMMCTGGRNPTDPDNPKDNEEHMMIVFFRDYLADALNKPIVKFMVIVGFLVYLMIGIYGCSVIKEGLDRRKLSRDDSYSVQYYDYEDKYFREYPYRIQIVINETLNYADPKVQQSLDELLGKFEASPYIADRSMTESWLRAYTTFLNQEDSFIFTQALNLTDPADFYRGLRDIFLHFPLAEQFRYDVTFNEEGTEIMASRFLVQTHNIRDANMEKDMLISLRELADSFPFPVTIYHHYFIFFDQFVLVRSISIQTITVAAIVMMIISLIFIPSPSCAIWVAFSIISIEIGVIGYMTLWNVNLDSISMINLIMCIGFSVDFSAHVSYAYYSCNERTPKLRVKYALASLGMPIFQGSISTVLGIIALAFAPSYVFVTFFKTVFLVMLFGATHGVLLLPVLLSLTDFCGGEPKTLDDALTESHEKRSPHDRSPHGHHNLSYHIDERLPPHIGGNDNRGGHHYRHSNLALMAPEQKFYASSKPSSSKAGIYIPRPSYIGGVYEMPVDVPVHMRAVSRPRDNISVEGSKSSDSSVVGGVRDLGLGTSAEECSESSWNGGERSDDQIIRKQPASGFHNLHNHHHHTHSNQSLTSHHHHHRRNKHYIKPHINSGYMSDEEASAVGSKYSPKQPVSHAVVARSKSSEMRYSSALAAGAAGAIVRSSNASSSSDSSRTRADASATAALAAASAAASSSLSSGAPLHRHHLLSQNSRGSSRLVAASHLHHRNHNQRSSGAAHSSHGPSFSHRGPSTAYFDYNAYWNSDER